MTYDLSEELFARHVVFAGDPVDVEMPYRDGDSVRPKFESVAAAILHFWSLDSSQDEECGNAQYGNGWHALFTSERAILHADNSGFVTAWRLPGDADINEHWARIEAGAVYEDDWMGL